MKTTLTILCMLSALCAAGAVQKPVVKKTSLSESELRELAKSVPDVKTASVLHSVAMATTNNVGRRQEYLKSAAACLFACDKRDIYQKHIKGKLQNAAEIESRLKDDCKQCSGKGKKERRCYYCVGKGQCPTCKGSGQIVAVSFGGPKGSKTCTKCNGRGRCDKCGGNGSTQDKCAACAGTGKVFSKTVAERVFRDSCNSIADGMNVNPEAKTGGVKSQKVVTKATEAAPNVSNDNDTVREAQKLFEKRCKTIGDTAEVRYDGNDYAIVENTNGNENFVVVDIYFGDRHYMIIDAPKKWYAAVGKCVEKIKSWVRVAAENKMKQVSKEIPIYTDGDTDEVYAYVDGITEGRGQGALLRKAVRELIALVSDMQLVNFIGTIKASDDSFTKFKASILMTCRSPLDSEVSFNNQIFNAYGTIEQIDKKAIEFLVFVNPESLAKARKIQNEKEDLFK